MPLSTPHTPIVPTTEWQGKSGLNPYGDFTLQVDAAVGEVLATLDRNGPVDSTLVILTSDNGQHGVNVRSNAGYNISITRKNKQS